MALIDLSYFWGEIYVAQKSNQAVSETTNLYINKYEQKFLAEMLGEQLYSDMIAGLAGDPPDAEWTTLRDKLVNSQTKVSPIANYCWYWMKRRDVSQAVGMGEIKPEGENGTIVSPSMQMVRTWNEMVDLNLKFYDWFKGQTATYGELPYVLPDYLQRGFQGRFILDKNRSYPDFYIKINTMNI